MGIKKFTKAKEVLRLIAPDAFKWQADNYVDFVQQSRCPVRQGHTVLIDGSSIIEKTLYQPGAGGKRGSDDYEEDEPESGSSNDGYDSITMYTSGEKVGNSVRQSIEQAIHQDSCHSCVFVLDLPDNKSRAKGTISIKMFLCVMLTSFLCADLEYAYRLDGVEPMQDDGRSIYITQSYFPTGDEWLAFKSNKYLRR
jgi:hypothetical protein